MATTPLTTFSGLASGIDSASLITSLVTLAKAPITRLEDQKTTYAAQSKKLTDIRTKLTTLQTATKAIDTTSESLLNRATSSDDKVFTAKASGGSSLGTFDIEVTDLAQAERTYSDAFAARDAAGLFGAGTVTIQVGSDDQVDVAIDADDTLDDVAAKINSSGAAVTAGISFDGTNYRLQVNANETGADNAITFGEAGVTLGLSNSANEARAAANAVIKFDDIEFESATNSITNVIPGVTLSLVAKGTATVQVDRDPASLKTKLDTFVSAYNDVMKTLNAEFSYSGVTKGPESLIGDSMLHQLQASLRSMVATSDESLSANFSTLASIGLSLQRDGTLALDADKLNTAAAQDYQGVASLLGSENGDKGLMKRMNDALDSVVASDGSLRSRITNLSDKSRSIDDQIDRQQVRIDKYEEQLRTQFANLESIMSRLQSQNQALVSLLSL